MSTYQVNATFVNRNTHNTAASPANIPASAPRALAEVPKAYIAQLALYRAVLARIYPEQTIRAALVFTAGPTVVELTGPVMDKALAEALGQVTPR